MNNWHVRSYSGLDNHLQLTRQMRQVRLTPAWLVLLGAWCRCRYHLLLRADLPQHSRQPLLRRDKSLCRHDGLGRCLQQRKGSTDYGHGVSPHGGHTRRASQQQRYPVTERLCKGMNGRCCLPCPHPISLLTRNFRRALNSRRERTVASMC